MSTDNHIGRSEIAQAGDNARRLARRMADLVLSSDVPAAHWDEVTQRLADLLAVHVVDQADDALPRFAVNTLLDAAA